MKLSVIFTGRWACDKLLTHKVFSYGLWNDFVFYCLEFFKMTGMCAANFEEIEMVAGGNPLQ